MLRSTKPDRRRGCRDQSREDPEDDLGILEPMSSRTRGDRLGFVKPSQYRQSELEAIDNLVDGIGGLELNSQSLLRDRLPSRLLIKGGRRSNHDGERGLQSCPLPLHSDIDSDILLRHERLQRRRRPLVGLNALRGGRAYGMGVSDYVCGLESRATIRDEVRNALRDVIREQVGRSGTSYADTSLDRGMTGAFNGLSGRYGALNLGSGILMGPDGSDPDGGLVGNSFGAGLGGLGHLGNLNHGSGYQSPRSAIGQQFQGIGNINSLDVAGLRRPYNTLPHLRPNNLDPTLYNQALQQQETLQRQQLLQHQPSYQGPLNSQCLDRERFPYGPCPGWQSNYRPPYVEDYTPDEIGQWQIQQQAAAALQQEILLEQFQPQPSNTGQQLGQLGQLRHQQQGPAQNHSRHLSLEQQAQAKLQEQQQQQLLLQRQLLLNLAARQQQQHQQHPGVQSNSAI